MALSNTEIQERLKNPKNKAQIIKAIKHEQWLRFHAEEATERRFASRYANEFEEWVRQMLPSDKFEFFLKMFRYPVVTNSIVSAMQDEFNKVFDSQNSSFTYEFRSEALEADYKQFLSDTGFWEKWKKESKEAMLKHVSAVCIIDMPEEEDANTDPYFYFQDIEAIRDFDLHDEDDRQVIEAVFVQHDKDKFFIVDDARYMIWKQKGAVFTLEKEVFHDLGYCPACFFWQESISKHEPAVKKSMITGALNNLDYLALSENMRRCLESYAAFPILEKYAEDCTYYEEVDNNKYSCEDGYLHFPKSQYPKRCPVCEKNKIVGAGTIIEHNVPASKDQPDTIGKSAFINPPIDNLDYWTTRTKELWDEIYYDCVGNGGDAMTQAVNKDQVRGNFDSKHNKIMKIAANLEVSANFILRTLAALKYRDQFISGNYSMGNKFYLQSAEEAQKEYKTAKDSAVPVYLLAYKRKQVDMVNTKGNPVDAQRLFIMENLEPSPDLSLAEMKDLELNTLRPEDYRLKAEFSERILKFEREYGSIVEFGRNLDFNVKIERIKEVLYSYGKVNAEA